MKDKVVFVIGGGTGIGRETAMLCAKNGAKAVIIGGRRIDKLQAAAKELSQSGCQVLTVAVDVSQSDSVDSCIALIKERFGCIDVMINSGGVCFNTPFNKISVDEWNTVIQTNLFGVFYCMQQAMGLMVEQGVKGSIVNVSSMAAKLGGGVVGAHYAASKAGVTNLTLSAATFGARYGIRVNAVTPGLIATDMTDVWDKDLSSKLVKTVPLRAFGQAEDVAEAIMFLASSKAKYITGEVLDINGGAYMD